METSIKGILERYEQLVLARKDLQDALDTTLKLLHDLKEGEVELSQVTVTKEGWRLTPSPQPSNGKVPGGILAEESHANQVP